MRKTVFILAIIAFLAAASIVFANTGNEWTAGQDNNNWLKTGGFKWDVNPWLSQEWFSPKGNWGYEGNWGHKKNWDYKWDWDYKESCYKTPCKPHCPVTPEPISSALFLLGGGALIAAKKARRK